MVLRSEAQAEAMWEAMVRMNNPNLVAERRRLEAEGVPAAELEARLRAWVWESLLPVDESRAIDRLHEYVAVGVTHFIVAARPPYDLAGLERFLTRVAARVRASRPAPSRAISEPPAPGPPSAAEDGSAPRRPWPRGRRRRERARGARGATREAQAGTMAPRVTWPSSCWRKASLISASGNVWDRMRS